MLFLSLSLSYTKQNILFVTISSECINRLRSVIRDFYRNFSNPTVEKGIQ